jgi:glucose/arabinose dehydrogenase
VVTAYQQKIRQRSDQVNTELPMPPPNRTLILTVNIAPAKGWPPGGKPVAAQGTTVGAFAAGLDHPRWLYVLPNGDVLVAETNAPPKPEDGKGIRGWMMKRVMKKTGAGLPSANPSRCCAMPRDLLDGLQG